MCRCEEMWAKGLRHHLLVADGYNEVKEEIAGNCEQGWIEHDGHSVEQKIQSERKTIKKLSGRTGQLKG